MNAKLARYLTKRNSKKFREEIKTIDKRIKKSIKSGVNVVSDLYLSDFAIKHYEENGYIITNINVSYVPERPLYKNNLSW